MDSWKVHVQTGNESILFLICIYFTWLAYFHSPCSVPSSALVKFCLPESPRIIASFCPFVLPAFDPQQQWQNECWQGDFEVCSCFLGWHCPHSPQSWRFSAWEAPDCPWQLLVLSALNLCCFLGRGCTVENEQISNCILTASSPKVPSYLAKHRAIKI